MRSAFFKPFSWPRKLAWCSDLASMLLLFDEAPWLSGTVWINNIKIAVDFCLFREAQGSTLQLWPAITLYNQIMLFHLNSVSIFIPTSFDIMPGMCCLLKLYFPPLWGDCNRKLYTLYNFEILQSTECKGLSKKGRLLMTLLEFVVFAGAQCASFYSDVHKIWSAFKAALNISLHWRLKQ